MDLCPFCGLPYEKEVKKGTTHHFDVCKSDSIILMHQLRGVIKLTSHYNMQCNACHEKMSTNMFVKHLEKSHPEVLDLVQKIYRTQRVSDDSEITTCHLCDAKFPAGAKMNHVSVFHPHCLSIVQQVSNSLQSTHKPNIPAMKCCVFCGDEYLKGNEINHISKCKGESVVLVKQLSERLKAVSRSQYQPFLVERCKACGMQIPAAQLVEHIAEFHPSSMYLVMKLTEQVKDAPKEDFKSCGLCHRLFLTHKLPDHYGKCHPESKSFAMEITKKLLSSNLEGNFNSATQDHNSSEINFLENKNIAVVKKVPKATRNIAKKGSLLNKPSNNLKKQGRIEAIKASVDKTQRLGESEVNVSLFDDISSGRNKDLQPLKKLERYSGSDFKARVKKKVVVTSVCENKNQQESGKLLCVRLKRLSSDLYQEYITNGYVLLKENSCNQTMANLQANTDSCLSKEVMENHLKTNSVNVNLETPCLRTFLVRDKIPVEITSPTKNIACKTVGNEIAPALDVTFKTLNPYVKLEKLPSCFIQEHINPECPAGQKKDNDFIQSLVADVSETVAISREFVKSLNNSTNLSKSATTLAKSPTSLEIADLKKYKRKGVTSNDIPSANFMEKTMKKTHGKETNKEVLCYQKQLRSYVLKHQEIPPNLKYRLINACKYLTDPISTKVFLHELLSIKDQKTRLIVRFLLNKLSRAVKKAPI